MTYSNVRSLAVRLLDGRTVDLQVPPPDGGPARYAIGLHKAASTLLDRVTVGLSGDRFPVLPFENALWEMGLGPEHLARGEYARILRLAGYVHCGIRHPHLLPLDAVMNSPSLLLVRNPLDSVVSWYYSFARSHEVPEARASIEPTIVGTRAKLNHLTLDEAVESDLWTFLVDEWAGAVALAETGMSAYVRYEDIINDPSALLRAVEDELDLACPTEDFQKTLDEVEPLPADERQDAHVRWGRPGQGQQRLSRRSTTRVLALCTEYCNQFDYGLSGLSTILPEVDARTPA